MVAVSVAVSAGLLESAWTGPSKGGPENAWLGVVALLAAFFVVTFPRTWWIPALAVLEEWVHLIAGYGILLPDLDRVFNHWSHEYVGFPLMPYLTFPALTLVGELLYLRFSRTQRDLAPTIPAASHVVRMTIRTASLEGWVQESPPLGYLAGPVNPPVEARLSLEPREGANTKPPEGPLSDLGGVKTIESDDHRMSERREEHRNR